jgi:hypothetical protein
LTRVHLPKIVSAKGTSIRKPHFDFGFRRCRPLATTSPHPSEARRPRCGQDNAAKTKSPVRVWQIRNIGAIYTEEVSNSA